MHVSLLQEVDVTITCPEGVENLKPFWTFVKDWEIVSRHNHKPNTDPNPNRKPNPKKKEKKRNLNTREYMGISWNTRECKGIRGNTREYRGIHGNT